MEENGNLVRFIFNQEREAVTEEDSTGIIRLIRGSALIARNTDAARTYYHYASDEMGSTTHIVDEAGNVQNRYEYDAWGNITAQEEAVPNRFKYTGQQFDPVTQQYYLRARFYNPVIARFTQEDTYRGDGLNLYAYCANNPVLYVDPTGHEKDVLTKVAEREPGSTVKYYRVQSVGGGSYKRIGVNSDGSLAILTQGSSLSVSTITIEHALYFKKLREGQGYSAEIIEWDMPQWFDEFIMENAISSYGYRSNPLNQGKTAPKIVDPVQSGSATALELPPIWLPWLEEYATNAKIISSTIGGAK